MENDIQKIRRPFKYTQNHEIDFEYLYHESVRLVYYIIRRLINDDNTVDDLVQETYIRAFDNIDKIEEKTVENFVSWIGRIALNQARDYLKKKKPVLFTDLVSSNDSEYEVEDLNINNRPDQIASDEEISKIIQKIMDTLPEDQRLCVFLFYFEDMTTLEISEYLELSENTVKSRMRYGKEKISQKIQGLQDKGVRFYSMAPLLIFAKGLKNIDVEMNYPNFLYSKKSLKNIKKKVVVKGAVTLIATVALLLGSQQVLNHKYKKPEASTVDTINIFDYITIYTEGVNGQGILSVDIDDNLYKTHKINLLLEDINISKQINLSNDEVVVLKINPSQNVENSNLFLTTQLTYTVSGLTEAQGIDPFQFLNVEFKGKNGEGTLSYHWNKDKSLDKYLESLNVEVSKMKRLSNGETIEIKIIDKNEAAQYYLTENQKSYRIKDLERVSKEISKPINNKPDIDVYSFIYNRMLNEVKGHNASKIMGMFTRDYYGNVIDLQFKDYRNINNKIKVGKINNQYLGYIEAEYINENDEVLMIAVVSYFDLELQGQNNIFIVNVDQNKVLNDFREEMFKNIIWINK